MYTLKVHNIVALLIIRLKSHLHHPKNGARDVTPVSEL